MEWSLGRLLGWSHNLQLVFLSCSFFPKSANGAPLRQDALSGLSSSIGQASFSSSPSSSAAASSSSFPSASRLPHSSSASSGLHYSSTHKPYLHHNKSFGDLELAKALLELPGSHSIAKGLNYHTPSPKPSPGKGKSLVAPKKKLSSSSPGEHEGYYPCNRCGRWVLEWPCQVALSLPWYQL